jgi:putative transposase
MCLRFAFLLITRVITWPRLSRREDARKTAEILILRHQLAVLQRHQARRPELNWADQALLATLFGVIPNARRHGLWLLVTPDTIVCWRRDIVRRRWGGAVHARQVRPPGDPPEYQGRGPPAGTGEPVGAENHVIRPDLASQHWTASCWFSV